MIPSDRKSFYSAYENIWISVENYDLSVSKLLLGNISKIEIEILEVVVTNKPRRRTLRKA